MTRGEFLGLALGVGLLVGVVFVVLNPEAGSDLADAAEAVEQDVEAVTTGTSWTLQMWAAIGQVFGDLGFQGRLMVLAHAAYESGWGTASAARNAHNAFNTTAGKDGSKTLANYVNAGGQVWREDNADWEYFTDADGVQQKRRIPQNWRAFEDWAGSVQDFRDNWINRRDYGAVKSALYEGDATAYVNALFAAKYFTLPVDQYLKTFTGVLSRATNLVPSESA